MVNPVEGQPRLYKNHLGGLRNWVAFRLLGQAKNTEALGAKVEIHTRSGKQYREVRFENNYLSRSPAQVHFGLGAEDEIEKVIITYPGLPLRQKEIKAPDINQLHIIVLD